MTHSPSQGGRRFLIGLPCILFLTCARVSLSPAGEHPRLIVDKAEAQKLRAKAKAEPFASMAERIKKVLADYPKEYKDDTERMYTMKPRDLASLYLLVGEKPYAEEAEKICLELVKNPIWNDPGSKGLTRAAAAVTVAMAYDACWDAWSDSARASVSKALSEIAQGMMKSMGAGANKELANNWQAVRYAGLGLAALASDEPGQADLVKNAYGDLKRHLEANLGENGWNPEGIGYTNYPWQFTGPFGVAAFRAGVGDLRTEMKAKVSMTLWTIYAGTVPIENARGRLGLRADLSDDHPVWNGEGVAGLSFWYVPKEYVPAARWMYDRLCGAEGDKSWDSDHGGAIYSMLLYPGEVAPKNPAEIAGLNYVDVSHGIAIFRNAFKDENDVVALLNAHSRQPKGCHGGPDTNTFRIIGQGGCFVAGGGRTGDTAGQTNLFPNLPPARAPGGLGKLDAHKFETNGSGYAAASGSCMGTLNHKRVFGVDYSARSGAAAVFVDAETSDNGRLWRLNTPQCNKVATAGRTFTITAPNGSSLACTVVEPAKVVFRTGTVRRDDPRDAHGVGYPYRGTRYDNNAYVEFDCTGNVLVVMTLQKGAAPIVMGEGSARNATLRVGAQGVQVAADKITFGQ